MICQMCQTRPATVTFVSPTAEGRVVGYYCRRCFAYRGATPPAPPGRPRVAWRVVLLAVVASWGLGNILIAGAAAGDLLPADPAERRDVIAFFLMGMEVMVGLGASLVAAMVALANPWAVSPPVTARDLVRQIPWVSTAVAWGGAAIALERWAVPARALPLDQVRRLALLLWAPLVPLSIAAAVAAAGRRSRGEAPARRPAASPARRALGVAAFAWAFGLPAVLVLVRPDLTGMIPALWFPIPPALIVWGLGTLALAAALGPARRPATGRAGLRGRAGPA